MANHSSATEREQTPHANSGERTANSLNLANSGQRTANSERLAAGSAKSTKGTTPNLNGRPKTEKKSVPGAVATGYQVALTLKNTSKTIITNAVRRRAQSLINDRSIDAQSRAVIRYGLETNDPWLPELVRRADAGETIIYTVNSLDHPHSARK